MYHAMQAQQWLQSPPLPCWRQQKSVQLKAPCRALMVLWEPMTSCPWHQPAACLPWIPPQTSLSCTLSRCIHQYQVYFMLSFFQVKSCRCSVDVWFTSSYTLFQVQSLTTGWLALVLDVVLVVSSASCQTFLMQSLTLRLLHIARRPAAVLRAKYNVSCSLRCTL